MAPGTRALFGADVGHVFAGKATHVRHANVCLADGTCGSVDDAVVRYDDQGGVWVGEATFVFKGQPRRVAFRAVSCPVPQSERVLCG